MLRRPGAARDLGGAALSGRGRLRPLALGLLAFGVVAELSALGRPWVTASLSPEQAAGAGIAVKLSASGREAAPVSVALALAAAACGVAGLLVAQRLRRALGVLLVVVSAAGAAACGGVLAEPSGAVSDRAAAVGVEPATLEAVAAVSGWAWAGVLAWILPLLGGLAVLAGPSARAAAPPVQAGPRRADAEAARPADVWEALSRGQDPT